jgi:hypothetical protein
MSPATSPSPFPSGPGIPEGREGASRKSHAEGWTGMVKNIREYAERLDA